MENFFLLFFLFIIFFFYSIRKSRVMGYPGVMSSPVLNFNQKDIWVMFSCGSINRLSSLLNT